MRFGTGELTYDAVEGWPRLPEGLDLVEVPAVGVDSKDNVYCFTRSEHPVCVFDREGNLLRTWGEGMFKRAHGICVGPDDSIYCVDDFDHTLRKCTPEGVVLMTIGLSGRPSDTGYTPAQYDTISYSGPPFHFPTSVALSPEGDIYVTDGYGNARVHKFSPDGKLLFSRGSPGSGPGQFRLPHGIAIAPDGTLYVGDRMNSRVQIFSPNGEFIAQWNDVYQPNELFLDAQGRLYIVEIGYHSGLPLKGTFPAKEDSHARLTIRNLKGEILSKIQAADPIVEPFDDGIKTGPGKEEAARRALQPGGFLSPHGVWKDSRGDLYVGEVSATRASAQGRDRRLYPGLHKFAHVGVGA